jgi:glutamate N-acetyltransferase/amino-acid N-acetyltransferase
VGGNRLGPKGFQAAGIACGIKAAAGAKDLALLYSEVPAHVAGLFTTNRVKAAPVLATMRRVRKGLCRALIVNSGNANACTGERGLRDAEAIARSIAQALHIPHQHVLVSSTGVIGHPLPMERIERCIPTLIAQLTADSFSDAAEAIMTTDTLPKMVIEKAAVADEEVTVLGLAKGAGMIHPQLATMLAFILTDAQADTEVLSALLKEGASSTFNRITVDGDTSTNDMIILMANGAASPSALHPGDSRFLPFKEALFAVMNHLARAIVRDGEGRTKVVEIVVRGAKNAREAERVAFRVAHSPLVKTAFFGQDPNWGRIMAAAGDAGVAFDPQKVAIYFDDILVVAGGVRNQGTDEKKMREALTKEEFMVIIDLHQGNAQTAVLTTDLSSEYVRINASYHT